MAASAKTIVVVTGANSGIGYELVSQLLDDANNHVFLGSRSAAKGAAALAQLQALGKPGTAEMLVVDVNDAASISAAAAHVQRAHGLTHILVNNAGIASAPGTLAEQMAACYQTNVTGALLVSDAFEPLLKAAAATAGSTPRIVNIGSGVGSLGRAWDPDSFIHRYPAYRCSKAALNMVTSTLHARLGRFGIRVFTYCPGLTVSGLSAETNAEHGARPTAESVRPLVGIVKGGRDAEAGGFLRAEGQWPW